MYRPPAFRLDREPSIDIVRQIGFGHLVVEGHELLSSPVPFLLNDAATVARFHLARANDITKALDGGANGLIIVAGPDSYVSPSWYPSKLEDPRVVPTWNYVVVHLRGRLSAMSDDSVRELVGDLTDHHEQRRDLSWRVDDAPTEYLDGRLRAIMGVEMSIDRVEGTAKLSQNRSEDDRRSVTEHLSDLHPEKSTIATAMDATL